MTEIRRDDTHPETVSKRQPLHIDPETHTVKGYDDYDKRDAVEHARLRAENAALKEAAAAHETSKGNRNTRSKRIFGSLAAGALLVGGIGIGRMVSGGSEDSPQPNTEPTAEAQAVPGPVEAGPDGGQPNETEVIEPALPEVEEIRIETATRRDEILSTDPTEMVGEPELYLYPTLEVGDALITPYASTIDYDFGPTTGGLYMGDSLDTAAASGLAGQLFDKIRYSLEIYGSNIYDLNPREAFSMESAQPAIETYLNDPFEALLENNFTDAEQSGALATRLKEMQSIINPYDGVENRPENPVYTPEIAIGDPLPGEQSQIGFEGTNPQVLNMPIVVTDPNTGIETRFDIEMSSTPGTEDLDANGQPDTFEWRVSSSEIVPTNN